MRSVMRIPRPKPVRMTSAPSSWARRATAKAIDLSVSTPVMSSFRPSRSMPAQLPRERPRAPPVRRFPVPTSNHSARARRGPANLESPAFRAVRALPGARAAHASASARHTLQVRAGGPPRSVPCGSAFRVSPLLQTFGIVSLLVIAILGVTLGTILHARIERRALEGHPAPGGHHRPRRRRRPAPGRGARQRAAVEAADRRARRLVHLERPAAGQALRPPRADRVVRRPRVHRPATRRTTATSARRSRARPPPTSRPTPTSWAPTGASSRSTCRSAVACSRATCPTSRPRAPSPPTRGCCSSRSAAACCCCGRGCSASWRARHAACAIRPRTTR